MLKRILDGIFGVAAAIGDIAVAGMVIVMFSEIVMRQGFNTSLRVADEVSGYLLVSATFFGLSAAIRRGALFRFENVVTALPLGLKRIYERFLYLLAFGVGAVLFWRLYIYTARSFTRGVVSEGYYAIPVWLVQIAMPLGLAVMLLAILERLVRPIQDPAS
ncbi:TRAP transporter small permease [Acuticoccus mangrovi]|uniref:TRAP transporter small permease protein n=1 Tax=Acuticoccus mangrovi TaxID=2796142 RepID=A0A934INK5_9HYPH|nr:TRAP transporter small permease subunit [Acuticoccus mangrovi]MBJ3775746.1 TRAP transporter small permease subunit [Acuticoccus mangrovi]